MPTIPVKCNLRVVPDLAEAKKLGMTPEEVSQELMTMLRVLELADKPYSGYSWPGNGLVMEVDESNGAPDFTALTVNVNGWLLSYVLVYAEYFNTPPPPMIVLDGAPNDLKLLLYYYSDKEERWCSYGLSIIDDSTKKPWRMASTKFKTFTAAVEVGIHYPMK